MHEVSYLCKLFIFYDILGLYALNKNKLISCSTIKPPDKCCEGYLVGNSVYIYIQVLHEEEENTMMTHIFFACANQ